MNTQENNKLIAEFMGAKPMYFGASKEYEMYGRIQSIIDGVDEKHFFAEEEMLFSTDWNWLMEVVEKIDHLGFVTEISGNIERSFALIGLANSNVSISRVGYGIEFMNKKDATYRAVVEFIKWYNEQK